MDKNSLLHMAKYWKNIIAIWSHCTLAIILFWNELVYCKPVDRLMTLLTFSKMSFIFPDDQDGDEEWARNLASRCSSNNVNAGVPAVPEEILHQQRLLLQSCDRLKLSVSRHQNNNAQNTGDVVDVIRQLGATLTKLIELMLSKEIKVIRFFQSHNSSANNRSLVFPINKLIKDIFC